LNLAAAEGEESVKSSRESLAQMMSNAEIEQAQALSRAWVKGELIRSIPDRAANSARPARNATAQGGIRQTTNAASQFPPRPAKRAGVVSCNTRCNNGDCFRTYDDGRQVRFQAQRRMNAFGEFIWDAGSC
jgi:hypothetical protein